MSAIAWVIFGLFCVGSAALALRDRTQSKERRASLHLVWLFAMLLEVEAMKARDRGKGRKPAVIVGDEHIDEPLLCMQCGHRESDHVADACPGS
jgi:hypothetical protein